MNEIVSVGVVMSDPVQEYALEVKGKPVMDCVVAALNVTSPYTTIGFS